jgi:hypothetical protein
LLSEGYAPATGEQNEKEPVPQRRPFNRILGGCVKTIETHQMRIKEKFALRSAAELRQKAREWLAKSALNRIREDTEPEYANGARRCVGL